MNTLLPYPAKLSLRYLGGGARKAMIHISIGTGEGTDVELKNSHEIQSRSLGDTGMDQFLKYGREVVRWFLLGSCFVYFGILAYSFGENQGIGLVSLLGLWVVLLIGFIFWKKAIQQEQKKESEYTRFFLCVVSGIVLALPAVISGNLWLVYLVTHMIVTNDALLFIGVSHLILFVISLAYTGTMFGHLLGFFPVLLALFAVLDYIWPRIGVNKNRVVVSQNRLTIFFSALGLLVTLVLLTMVALKLEYGIVNYLLGPAEKSKLGL
ncbi:hypothetical protein NEHOM01_2222 [Nematocida homosporus]|uniref:uncharacterized protein n=1 Tax=Nematocida homosporus TaxID=1912981 RepID=UPI002220414E|nr:uncharacterized protein NEHOM01_2222 [Nematocida homosporus]KAI5187495.1 hypothetical protein NEHOM01_2222 [Nematocida homosporus]